MNKRSKRSKPVAKAEPRPETPRQQRYLVAALLALTGAILVWQLFVRPFVAYADNGDFNRVTGPLSIFAPVLPEGEQYFNYSIPYLVRAEGVAQDIGYRSSESLVIHAVNVLHGILAGGAVIDLRWLGAVHGLLFMTALFPFFGALITLRRTHVLTALTLVTITTDVSYVAFFNTPYGEAGSIVALIAAAGSLLYLLQHPSSGALALFTSSAALFVFAKPQNAASGLIFAACLFVPPLIREKGLRNRVILSAIVLISTATFTYAATPRRLRLWTYHTAVLFPLPAGEAGAGELRDLNLEPALARFAGTTPFLDSERVSAGDYQRFLSEMTMGRIVRWLIAKPSRITSRLDASARASLQSSISLGMFPPASATAPRAESEQFRVWSRLRERVAPKRLGTLLIVTTLFAMTLAAAAKRLDNPGPLVVPAATVALVGLTQYVTVSLLQGTIDTSKHMMLFKLAFDLSLVFLLAIAIECFPRRTPEV